MAKNTTVTENEKTVLITVVAALVLVAGWAGYAAVLGFTGAANLTASTSSILAGIAIADLILIGVIIAVFRKRR